MKKVMIIKESHNSFEQFYTNALKNYADVYSAYKPVGKIRHMIRAVCRRTKNYFLNQIWMEDWKKKLNQYDTVIVFDNSAPHLLLKSIRKIAPNIDLKVWLWNVPERDCSHFKKYAEVVCFDKEYADLHHYRYVHQFLCVNEISLPDALYKEWDAVYIGADKGRYQTLRGLAQRLRSENKSFFFYLLRENIKEPYMDDVGIMISDQMIPYENTIQYESQCKAIVELCVEGQKGMTLRTLEAIYLGKKLISNNSGLRNESFFSSHNIYLLDEQNMDTISDFLDERNIPYDASLKESYTCSHWFQEIVYGE